MPPGFTLGSACSFGSAMVFCRMVFESPWKHRDSLDCSRSSTLAFFHQFVTDISVIGFEFQFGVNTEKAQARLRLKAGYVS